MSALLMLVRPALRISHRCGRANNRISHLGYPSSQTVSGVSGARRLFSDEAFRPDPVAMDRRRVRAARREEYQSKRFQQPVLPTVARVLTDKEVADIVTVWPSPENREIINETIELLTEDLYHMTKAKAHFIDKGLWLKVLPVLRRQLNKDPQLSYKSNQTFSAFIFAIEAVKDKQNVKGLGILKGILYEGALKVAVEQFSNDIVLYKSLLNASDLRVPHEWYPRARLRKRRFIYHGGPTNSGKTYQALKRLREADSSKGGGLYCGPLRLLALEVYESLTRQGIYCDLSTGQEKRTIPESTHVSCTVELVSVTREFDVAVVDEIQMIGNSQRGHAWTRAVQGLLANEIHICGGLESRDSVQAMVEEMGDSFELVTYDRLSPLVVADHSLKGDYSEIRKGDCIVAFSKNDLYSIKAEIERLTPHKCCMIYGQLPPETRSMQARLFNDENTGFDVLVASDAIGMGLNLNIRRIIFHTTMKRGGKIADKNGDKGVWLHPSFVKQIAGRAGRLSSNYDFGEVTAWQEHDLAYIRAAMSVDVPQLTHAGIFPSVEQLEEFSEFVQRSNNGVPITNLAALMSNFVEAAQLDRGRYTLSDHTDMTLISNWLNTIPLSLRDRFTFANAPVSTRDAVSAGMIYQYAAQYALKRPVAINITLSDKPPTNVLELTEVCMKHTILDLYIWLSLRFPDWFVEREKCLKMKETCIEMVEGALELDDLKHKFCHADEYRKIRMNARKDRTQSASLHPLPPVYFGGVRDIAADLMKDTTQRDMFSFPHQTPLPMRLGQNSNNNKGSGPPGRNASFGEILKNRGGGTNSMNSSGNDRRPKAKPPPRSSSGSGSSGGQRDRVDSRGGSYPPKNRPHNKHNNGNGGSANTKRSADKSGGAPRERTPSGVQSDRRGNKDKQKHQSSNTSGKKVNKPPVAATATAGSTL